MTASIQPPVVERPLIMTTSPTTSESAAGDMSCMERALRA
jgi:hypothetical protein